MNEKYLPIGSVVLLKNAKKSLMITGYLVMTEEDKDNIYDYSGCLFPVGILDSTKNAIFNHDDIEKILFLGYANDEYKEINEKLKGIEIKENPKEVKKDILDDFETVDVTDLYK